MPKYTINQTRAINEFGTNIIVSAGAGSGKTAVLTERVVNHIKNGIHINELLILTFTNKAAMEMKDRIRSNLKDYPEELKLLTTSYVTTFDSYALSIVKKYSYLLNIGNVSVTDESVLNPIYDKVIDDVFENEYISNVDFKNLIKRYGVKDDDNIRNVILNICNKIDELGYDRYLDIINNFYSDDNINNLINEYYQILKEKIDEINLYKENLSTYFDSKYIDKVSDSLKYINMPVKDLYTLHEIKLPNLPKNTEDDAKLSKEELKLRIDELLDLLKYGSYDDIKNDILNTKKDTYIIMNIAKKYIDNLNAYKKNNDIYTFSDIAKLAIKILKEFDIARKETKFKEIMIDEYQDTNDVEEEFISLISDNNVYTVGDIKQSIYRFRGSNPNIFKDKYDKYKNNNGGIAIDLLENFRSRSEVLKNINEIFNLIMDIDYGGCEYTKYHNMIYANKVYDTEKSFDYDMDILEYDKIDDYSDTEIEIFTIAKDIKDKIENKYKVYDKKLGLRDIKYSDFSIILDRSKYFNLYKRIFEYLSIPLTILKDDDLTLNEDMSLITNIIDFIIKINNKEYDKEYKYDFVSIARSFLYEYDDNTIYEAITNNTIYNTSIYKDLNININSFTSSELISFIIDKTDYYNKLYKVGDALNVSNRLKSIYNLAVSLENYSIIEFKEYLKETIKKEISIKYDSKTDNTDSVKILTIHASKGLEYPICYFADLNHEFNIRDLNTKFIMDTKYGIVNSDSFVKELYKYNYKKEELSEKIRLFYVALTRAREKIIIVVPNTDVNVFKDVEGLIDKSIRSRFNKLLSLISSVKPYLNKYYHSINLDDISLTKDYLYNKPLNKLEKNNNMIIVDEINIDSTIINNYHFSKEKIELIDNDTKNKMNIGTKVHEILEYLDFKNPNLNNFDDNIKEKITNFLNLDIIKNASTSKIYKEYEFIYENDDIYHGIIDLMIEHDTYIDIIDYKLKNIDDDAYNKQLKGYKDYIKSISDKEVNTYLYSILDGVLKKV